MNVFLNLIRQHRSVVILIFLVLFSLSLLVTGARATLVHKAVKRVVSVTAWPFLKTRYFVQDTAGDIYEYVFHFDRMAREIDRLTEETARQEVALSKLEELRGENERLRGMLHFVREDARLTLEPVEVIESLHGMITIDEGRLHGIREAMCVITSEGVVGVVIEVDDLTARVATLHHQKCRIGAMVVRNRLRAYDGVVHGAAGDWQFVCTMDYIDTKDEVRVGDRVVTSPESLFPAGYPIGMISAPPHGSGTLWKWAEITPTVDPYRLDEVFVIRRAVPALDELTGTLTAPPGRAAASQAPELPDRATLQERYAP